jgi:hypothetical protein
VQAALRLPGNRRAVILSHDVDVEWSEKHGKICSHSTFNLPALPPTLRSFLRLVSPPLLQPSAPSATIRSWLSPAPGDETHLALTMSGRRTSCLPPWALHIRAWIACPHCLPDTSLICPVSSFVSTFYVQPCTTC